MRTFTFFLTDRRYTVPTVAFITAVDVGRAVEIARQQLDASPHHLAIELRENDELVGRIDRDGEGWLRPEA
jgi:ribosome-binding protein aMBF1 (putative translation factor)